MRFISNFIKRTSHILAITLSLAIPALVGCQGTPPAASPTATGIPTASQTPLAATTAVTATPTGTATATPGPSPTSTYLPPLAGRTWQAEPVLIEAARIEGDPLNPFQYTPLLVLYGDGRLVQRRCQDDGCQYRQTTLTEEALCQLVNAIDRTGFLSTAEDAYSLPGETGAVIRLAVHLDVEKVVDIPDLDRWISDPGWYLRETGCVTCDPATINPAVIALYRLLTTYAGENWTGLETERLAVWLSEPLIAGTPQSWDADLIPLADLAARADCGDGTQGAVILEGAPATALADVLASLGNNAPLFEQDGVVWQVQSRWLVPYESPQTCGAPAGLTLPPVYPTYTWSCSPLMGAIPTPTPTITPTPTATGTPIR
jgi:hypothetical protein